MVINYGTLKQNIYHHSPFGILSLPKHENDLDYKNEARVRSYQKSIIMTQFINIYLTKT